MKTVIAIQHTQSMQHTNGMIGSWTDWDLTPTGIEQAARIGRRLFEELGKGRFAMYSSDLLRAKHTAQIVAGYFQTEPVLVEALREFDLGSAVGKPKAWAKAHAACELWPGTIDWAKDIDGRPFPGAETKREVWARLSQFHERLMQSPEENVIIVSHDGTLSLFYALWLGLDVEMLRASNLSGKSGGVSLLREDEHRGRAILRLNDLSYMR